MHYAKTFLANHTTHYNLRNNRWNWNESLQSIKQFTSYTASCNNSKIVWGSTQTVTMIRTATLLLTLQNLNCQLTGYSNDYHCNSVIIQLAQWHGWRWWQKKIIVGALISMLAKLNSESDYRGHVVSKDVRDVTQFSLLHQQTVPVVKRSFAELSIEYNHHITASAGWVIMVSLDHHWLCPAHNTVISLHPAIQFYWLPCWHLFLVWSTNYGSILTSSC